MTIKGKRLSTLSTSYLIGDIITLIFFLFLPIVSDYLWNVRLGSASFLTLPIKLLSVGFGSQNSITALYGNLSIVCIFIGLLSLILFYSYLVCVGVALYELFVKGDIELFDSFSRQAYMQFSLAAVITIAFYGAGAIIDTVEDNGILGNFTLLFRLRYGIWINLIVGIGSLYIHKFIASAPNTFDIRKDSQVVMNTLFKRGAAPQEEEKITGWIDFQLKDPAVIILEGENTLEINALPALLGRKRDAVDIVISNPSVSREHCQFLEYEGMILLVDKGSTSGTILEGETLVPEKFYQVNDGDRLEIGEVEYTVRLNRDLEEEVLENHVEIGSLDKTVKLEPKTAVESNKEGIGVRELKDERIDLDNPRSIQAISNKTVSMSKDSPVSARRVDNGPALDVFKMGPNQTVKLDYNGGQTRFPRMQLRSQTDWIIVDKTPFIIGSDPNKVDHELRGEGISKQHVKIHRENDEFYVTDLNSKNGVNLNGYRLTPSEAAVLRAGDTITLGRNDFRFENA